MQGHQNKKNVYTNQIMLHSTQVGHCIKCWRKFKDVSKNFESNDTWNLLAKTHFWTFSAWIWAKVFMHNLLKKAFATWQHAFFSLRSRFMTYLIRFAQKSKFWDHFQWGMIGKMFSFGRTRLLVMTCQLWTMAMTPEVEQRLTFTTASYSWHRYQWVKGFQWLFKDRWSSDSA